MGLQVTGRGGLPGDGVSAVVLNVAVTNPTASGWLTAWPAGAELPLAANLNFVAGQTVANSVVVKVGAGGQVSFYNSAARPTSWRTSPAGTAGAGPAGGVHPLVPARILDTRFGLGAPRRRSGRARPAVQINGQGGVPASGVTAVVLNVAVTNRRRRLPHGLARRAGASRTPPT